MRWQTDAADEAEAAIYMLERGKICFLVLNAFPYNSGHLMVVPYRHEAVLAALPLEEADELLPDDAAGGAGAAGGLPAAWAEYRAEPGQGGGSGGGGTPAHACGAALDGGHQLHERAGGDARSARDAGRKLAETSGSAGARYARMVAGRRIETPVLVRSGGRNGLC